MPITKSAKKALRQSKKRRERNLAQKKSLKTKIRRIRKLVEQKKLPEAAQFLSQVYKALDKSAKTNLIKKNKASRLKSRLTQLINKSVKAAS